MALKLEHMINGGQCMKSFFFSKIVIFLKFFKRKSPLYTLELSQKSDFQPLTIKPDNKRPSKY